jgi:hypothetical protein
MIRRYLKSITTTFRVGGRSIGDAEMWIGIEIDSDEPLPESFLEERNLQSAAAFSDDELLSRGVTTWNYLDVGDPSTN